MPRTRSNRVSDHDLIDGICYMLIILGGWPNYAPSHDKAMDHRNAFDMSMWQALKWLEFRYREMGCEEDVRAHFRPDWLYWTSGIVQGTVSQMLGFAFYMRSPFGRGVYYCQIDADRAESMLEWNAIDRELLVELARRFRREYDFAAEDREWPPDFDFDHEFERG